jgi:pimeloyl-ACP methyl ester carboxylesterase
MRSQGVFRFGNSARGLIAATLVVWVAAGCGGDDAGGSGETMNGSPAVTQRSVTVPGSDAGLNPVTGAATPAELNRAYAQIYQADGVSDDAVQKVLVLMPGFLGGANNFDYFARRIVERSGGKTAVWAVDRRSNALEDQTGLDAAEAGKDPDIAKDYYFHGKPVGGRTFGGFVADSDASFVSEWGIRVHVEDLHALIVEVTQRYPKAAVILGGHSLGGSIVPIYAAWDFGGEAGFERLSGLLLLEGAPSPTAPVASQASYETQGISGGIGRSSLRSIRSGSPFASLQPFLDTDLYVSAQIVAMRASPLFGFPHALSPDADLTSGFVGLLFGLSTLPPITNRAALGFGFDNDFEPLSFVRASIGQPTGGAIGPNPNAPLLQSLLGITDPLLAPIDLTATYDWLSFRDLPHPEPTDIDTLARVLFQGPSDFIEWYFPARLTLDAGITANLNVQPAGDWRKEVYGLNVTENARVDVPVFAVGGSKGLLRDLSRLDPYRSSIAPTLRNGTSRNTSPAGFQTMLMPDYVHLDVLTAEDSGAGNGEFAAIVEWMDEAVRLAPPRHR